MSGSLLMPLVLLLVGVAVLLTLYRFLRGPIAADRIVAADTLTVIATGAIAVLALLFGSSLYLDLALLLGTLAFVGVIALARVVEQQSVQRGER
jgi:multisubunit Na+/H+ antiporter MnhF subunit